MKRIIFSLAFLLFASFILVGCQRQKGKQTVQSDQTRPESEQVKNTTKNAAASADTQALITPVVIKRADDVDQVINNVDKALNDVSSEQLNLDL